MIMDNAIDALLEGLFQRMLKMPRLSWLKLKNIFRDLLKLMPGSS
jgi:hypothetical protein